MRDLFHPYLLRRLAIPVQIQIASDNDEEEKSISNTLLATQSLLAAIARKDAFAAEHPLALTHPTFLNLSAEVMRLLKELNEITLNSLQFQEQIHAATRNSLSLHKYLQIIPPFVTYADELPGPNITAAQDICQPQLILHWETFESEVSEFIRCVIEPQIGYVERFPFDKRIQMIESEVPSLRGIICSLSPCSLVQRCVQLHVTSEAFQTVTYG